MHGVDRVIEERTGQTIRLRSAIRDLLPWWWDWACELVCELPVLVMPIRVRQDCLDGTLTYTKTRCGTTLLQLKHIYEVQTQV